MDWEYSAKMEGLRRVWNEDPSQLTNNNNDFNADSDDMEVDPSDYLIIVPDTNIWIGYPDLLKKILNTDFEKVSYPTIVIPWMVLQELDVLSKDNNKPDNRARKSVGFIHDLLMSKHPRVRGQKASEVVMAQEQFNTQNADDRILQCALQCVEKSSYVLVVFLTNDRNLLNKALVECTEDIRRRLLICDSNLPIDKINAKISLELGGKQDQNVIMTSSRRRISPVRKLSNHSSSKIVTPQTSNSKKVVSPVHKPLKRLCGGNDKDHSSFKQTAPKRRQSNVSIIETRSRTISNSSSSSPPSSKSSFCSGPGLTGFQIPSKSDTFSDILELARALFSYIIEFTMTEDFGEIFWKRSLKYQPPWTLETALKCLIHHHFGVFSNVFGRRSKPQLEALLVQLQEYNREKQRNNNCTSQGLTQLEEDIIELILTLLLLVKAKSGDSKLDKTQVILDSEKLLQNYITQHKV